MLVCAKCGHRILKTKLLDFVIYESLDPLPDNVTLPNECSGSPMPEFGPNTWGTHEPR